MRVSVCEIYSFICTGVSMVNCSGWCSGFAVRHWTCDNNNNNDDDDGDNNSTKIYNACIVAH